jgi:hypothetical protein
MANPLNRQSFAEVMKHNVDGCNLQASMNNNFMIRGIFAELQKLSRLKISCPMKKVIMFDAGLWSQNLDVYIFRDNTESQTGLLQMTCYQN